MQQEQENVISVDVKNIATKAFQLSIFVALVVVAPYFGNQLITGSIVNALLFISVAIMGVELAFLLCLMPSLVSIYTGLLPLALAPMIPFIMTGNALLVLVFYRVTRFRTRGVPRYGEARNFWAGAIPAVLIKFIFIWAVGSLLVKSVLIGIAPKITLMVSWTQLATAFTGACIAYLFLKTIKKI